MLGRPRTSQKASEEPDSHAEAEDEQRPHKSGHPDHCSLIAESPKSSVSLEQPSLHHVARSYHDERRKIVHMSEGHRCCDASEHEDCQSDVSKPDPHSFLRLNWDNVCLKIALKRRRSDHLLPSYLKETLIFAR